MVKVLNPRKFWRPAQFLAWLAALLLGLAFDQSAHSASMRATLDRNVTSVGESVNLSLIFEGAQPDAQLSLPNIPGIQMGGVSTWQNFTMVNGQSKSETTYTYVLFPTKPGDFTIPSIRANAGGQTLASQPLKLKVTQSPASAQTTPDGQPSEAFLKLVAPKTEIYLGEIIPAEVRLYYQYVNNANLPQVPAEGFIMSAMPNRPEQTQARINGMNYNLATFRFSLTAAKTGTLAFGPATCNVTILSGAQRDFFGQLVFSKQRPVILTSETNSITVLPLPEEGKPSTFTGAIGVFNMNVSVSPTDVAVGDPITVKVDVSGRGALDSLTLPPQPAWREFKMYSPNSKIDSTDPLGLEGTKHFDLVISPQNAGIKELPPLQFSFFDPDQKKYRTLTSQPIRLNVRAGAATPQPTVTASPSGQETPQQPSKEIVHIEPQLGVLHKPGPPLIRQAWFIGLQALAPLLWIGAMVYRKQMEKWENNPRLRRQRAVEKTVATGLQNLMEQAAANRSDDFFATVFHLLQEQIGERLDLPALAITEAILEELKGRMNPEALGRLRELFDLCNQARYAPVRGSQQLAALIPKVEQAIDNLKQLKDERIPVSA